MNKSDKKGIKVMGLRCKTMKIIKQYSHIIPKHTLEPFEKKKSYDHQGPSPCFYHIGTPSHPSPKKGMDMLRPNYPLHIRSGKAPLQA